jgi:cell division septation protein DedD
MTTDQRPGDSDQRPAPSDTEGSNTRDSADQEIGRREPVFTEFREEEDYAESDRDTDYASAYEDEPENQAYGGSAAIEDEWNEEEEDYQDDYQEEYTQTWPLGLIAVALVALLLLGAGGYGVIQQRAAMQEEIRQLQGSLATSANPDQLSAGRAALRELEQRNSDQLASLDAAKAENRRLQDRVAELELQLQAVASGSTSAPAKANQATVTGSNATAQTGSTETRAGKPGAPAPDTPKSSGTGPASTAGDWFVNFGSYSQSAVAQSWAKKIKPAAGQVAVSPSSKDGKTFYRVRVVALADRAEAEKVSRQLQQDHGLPKLWVGSNK